MKLSILKLFLLSIMSNFYSAVTLAEIKLEEAKKLTPNNLYVRILKEKKIYYLEYLSITVFNENGIHEALKNGDKSYQILRKKIKIPVSISLEKTGGFGGKIQFLGFGDDDVKTGTFKNIEKLRLGDLFNTYEGTSTNIGLTLIGGGHTKMTSPTGAILKEGNGSIAMIGPAGTPIGINTGFEHINFNLTIFSQQKAALVKYELETVTSTKGRVLNSKTQEVLSFDEIAQIELAQFNK